jgi:hypothetical protein
MRSRCMSLLPLTTFHSDSEHVDLPRILHIWSYPIFSIHWSTQAFTKGVALPKILKYYAKVLIGFARPYMEVHPQIFSKTKEVS